MLLLIVEKECSLYNFGRIHYPKMYEVHLIWISHLLESKSGSVPPLFPSYESIIVYCRMIGVASVWKKILFTGMNNFINNIYIIRAILHIPARSIQGNETRIFHIIFGTDDQLELEKLWKLLPSQNIPSITPNYVIPSRYLPSCGPKNITW